MANLTMAYIAASARAGDSPESKQKSDAQRAWLIDCIRDVWNGFAEGFDAQWKDVTASAAKARPETEGSSSSRRSLIWDEVKVQMPDSVREQFIHEVWEDTIGFFGCFTIRRIVGVAHIQDFESIEDVKLRAACERKALQLAMDMLLGKEELRNIDELVTAIKQL